MPNIANINAAPVNGAEAAVNFQNPLDRLSTTGWDLVIILGGRRIPNSYIVDILTVVSTEDTNTLCDFTLRIPASTIDLTEYQGKAVTVDVLQTGSMRRIFTGVVDIPEVDISLETITCRCTNRIEELINSTLGNVVQQIGGRSDYVHSVPNDVVDQLNQRMTTIPYSYHFNPYNVFILTAWQPKSTPDATLVDADVYYATPEVEVNSRGRVVNKINIKLEYRFERMYNMDVTFDWTSPIDDDNCFLFRDGATLTHKALVDMAIQGTGWTLNGSVSYTAIMPAGWYECGGQKLAWSPVSVQGTTVYKREPDQGNGLPGNIINDANGNPIVDEVVTNGLTDYTNVYCLGANFTLSTRWVQTLTEEYAIAITSPQSITQYGTIDTDESYGFEDPVGAEGWENKDARFDTTGFSGDYYIDRDLNREGFNQVFAVAANKAKTSILKSHRENFVRFRTAIWPALDLNHTVELDTSRVDTKGKVRNYRHYFDIATGEAYTDTELALSKAQGSQAEDVFSTPTPPDTSFSIPAIVVTLGNHFGEDPSVPEATNWTGMIGNKFIGGWKTQFPESFVVITPPVPDELRETRTLETNTSYNISVPNDALTITFDGVLDA